MRRTAPGSATPGARCRNTLTSITLLAVTTTGAAAERAIEELRLSGDLNQRSVEIVFTCPASYLSHSDSTGLELTVSLALGAACEAALGGGQHSELHEPLGRNSNDLFEAEFSTVDARRARVVIRLGRQARFAVRQASRTSIRISIGAPADSSAVVRRPPESRTAAATATLPASLPSTPAESIADAAARSAASASAGDAASAMPLPRRPISLVRRAPEPGDRYAVLLAQGDTVANHPGLIGLNTNADTLVYVKDESVGAHVWQELRLGFFASEGAANAELERLSQAFPEALVVVADLAEQDIAPARPAVPLAPRQDPRAAASATLSAERMDDLLTEATDAMLDENYARAVQVYSRLLEEPGFSARREARERLGLARERNNQAAQAKLEYDAYLAEFPDGEGAERVRQRRAGLAAVSNPRQENLRSPNRTEPAFSLWGGVSQYYRRDDLEPLEGLPTITSQSALLSHLDLNARRRGERFDWSTRVNGMYHYNLLDRGPIDQLGMANAYFKLVDKQRDWTARFGRQSLHQAGVLGRFDGVHLDYRWRPSVTINAAFGRPVAFQRHAIDQHREFLSLSADLTELIGRWDFSFFGIAQTVDGIADRQALGGEAHYRSERWNLLGALDYDASYAVLNSALLHANWQATPKLTLYGRFNVGAAPYLTTSNALRGENAGTIADLLGSYDEAQIRRLARDRTAQSQAATVGLSRALFDRFQLNLDLSYAEQDETLAAGNVAAIPGTGGQVFIYMSFVGSSIFRRNDTTIFAFRRSDTTSGSSDAVTLDVRLPLTPRFRLSSRLTVTTRHHNGLQQTTLAPRLRIAYRRAGGARFEAELGAELSNRETPGLATLAPIEEQSIGRFVNLGYWWEF